MLKRLRRAEGDWEFSDHAKWLSADCTAPGEWYRLEGEFKTFGRTVLLLCAPKGAEVMLDGKLVHRFVTRSYPYCPVYEALELTPLTEKGSHRIGIILRNSASSDTGDVLIEIISGAGRFSGGDGSLPLNAFSYPAVKPGAYFYLDNGIAAEEFDARLDCQGKPLALKVIGRILHGPVRRLRLSERVTQRAEKVLPRWIAALERAKPVRGFIGVLGGLSEACVCGMFTCEIKSQTNDTLTVYGFGGLESANLDGEALRDGIAAALTPGTHVLELRGRDIGVLVETLSELGVWKMLPLVVEKSIPRHYPWNDELPGIVKTSVTPRVAKTVDKIRAIPAQVSPPTSEMTAFARRRLTAEDGRTVVAADMRYAREKIRSVAVCDDEAGKSVVIAPHEYDAVITFDFGMETVGYVMLETDAPEGTEITMRCFEVINEKGEQYVGQKNEIRYTAGKGGQVWTSHCRRGFRYVEVTVPAVKKPIRLSLAAEATGYPTGRGAEFASSDMLTDRVFRMCEDTARVCMLDAYVDCPGYEQNIWTGDARITALLNLRSFGAFEYNADYLRLISESLSDELTECYRSKNRRYLERRFLTCGVFPTYPDGNIPIWSYQWILSVYDHYMHTGDTALLTELMPAVRESLSRSEGWYSHRGLLAVEGAWNLVDWANNDFSEYGEVTVNNMMLVGCFNAAAFMERELGRPDSADDYTRKADELTENINRYCWSVAENAYVDTVRDEAAYEIYLKWLSNAELDGIPRRKLNYNEFRSMERISVQTATFAVLYGIAEGERLRRCADIVIEQASTGRYVAGTPAARTHGKPSEEEAPGGVVRVGSPFFMFFLIGALYKLGKVELAEHCMRRDWGGMLSLGLETCPEVFSPAGRLTTRSIAHAWSASPAVWLASEALGVRPLKPGYTEFSVRPLASTLKSAEGSIQTPRGPIRVSWKRGHDGSYDIHCDNPEGTVWIRNELLESAAKQIELLQYL